MMHVLLLTVEYPPHMVGGLGRHTADLSLALAAQGHLVDVVTVDPTGRSPGVEERGRLRIHRGVCAPYPEAWEQAFPCANLAMQRALYAMGDPNWDVIHFHERSALFAAQTALGIRDAPVVYTAHSVVPRPRNPEERTFDLALEASAVAMARCTVGVSAWVAQQLAARYPEARFRVVPNGVFVEDFLPAVPVRPAGRARVFVGRLVRRKGLHCLLGALAGLDAEVPGWSLEVVGDGPERSNLECLAAELGIAGRVVFRGQGSRADVIAALGRADLAVFPSLVEPFGIVVLEAMARGVPVLTGDTTGIAGIFTPGVHGWQCRVEDPQALRAALVEALTSSERPARAAAARLLVQERYTWTEVGRQLTALYSEL
jgi:glycosyltransferase involved in cell wall biosynthesis